MKDGLQPGTGVPPTGAQVHIAGDISVVVYHGFDPRSVLFPVGTGPENLDGPGNKVNLRDELFLLVALVLEEGRRGPNHRVFPVLEVDKRVKVSVPAPAFRNAVNKTGGVGNPLGGVESPFLRGDVLDKVEPNRDMVGEDMGCEGPGRALG